MKRKLTAYALSLILAIGAAAPVFADETVPPELPEISGEMPEGEKPEGEAPNGEMPEGEKPEGEAPDGERPEGEMPDGEKPEGEAPDGEMPEGEKPEGEAPNGEKPAEEQSDPNNETPFSDILSSSWYYSYVLEAYNAGYISGKTETSFAPNETITGAQLIVMLFGAEGLTLDSSQLKWYQSAVDWAKENGLITDDLANFDPDKAITREDVMYILCRYLIYKGKTVDNTGDLSQFNDKSLVSDYAVSSAALLVDEGIISGSDGNLNPKDSLTRAESAVIIVKIIALIK
ncbi:MAG: S-layer homology domain-containing protein [Clostridiales bacterium]|nr:S-layer homology domain-containing protein [Clostridiales bacterium]